MHTLSVFSGNLNFLEGDADPLHVVLLSHVTGCYHAYAPYNAPYPGIVLSTGTEDYFDSAWYFNGGEFHLENAGFTHIQQNGANKMSPNVTFSAYRYER